jgi:Domain of unknown function (DUF4412)
MRVPFALSLAAALSTLAVVPVGAAAQGTFEGVITFRVTQGNEGPTTMTYSVKGDKARMDLSAGGMEMYSVVNATTNIADVVIPMRQMYMEQSLQSSRHMADSAMANAKIDWTGKKETIAGYECEHANVADDQGKMDDLCLAKGLGTFMAMGGGMGRGRAMGTSWAGHLGQVFPLKVVEDGQVQMEVTKIEKKSIDDSIFNIPDGYQKMSMPMGGRRGGGR